MKTFECFLSAFVHEAIDVSPGTIREETERGYFDARHRVELPFIPRVGMRLVNLFATQQSDVHFEITSVQWDLKRRAFLLYGELNLLLLHESDADTLDVDYAPWEWQWVDESSFDEDGNRVGSRWQDHLD